MKHHDELRNEGSIFHWRYLCDCGYATALVTKNRAEFYQRIHRHRVYVGRAPFPYQPPPART